jgi:hypothetical protein
MPRLSVWMVRLSLAHLAMGFTFGSLLLANKGIPFAPAVWSLLPAHMELLLVGWVVQLAMGVAFWILPRFGQGASRGDERLAWLAFGLLNLGVVLIAAQPVIRLAWLPLAGRLAESGAALLFLLSQWRRVKPFAA